MSFKSSPSKNYKTSPPSKKDDKASTSAILTRNQSTFLSTRQLRNKDSSRKKISEFTRQLLGPKRERKPTQSKKNSPKEKKEKVPVEQNDSVTKLELEQKMKKGAQKRKHIISVNKVMQPAKSSRVTASLSAHELIDMCEDQSLDDEGFMEILTCESPVWWEDPRDFYEGSIFSHSKEKRYFQEFFEEIKSEPPDHPEPATTNITIPRVKQSDDKFMKKRNKLESLLGNIKNKLSEPAEDMFKQDIEKQTVNQLVSLKAKKTANERSLLEQEIINNRTEREKAPSESTSSSDELFFGFQNEDILKDLENMNIPIESDSAAKENDESDRNTSTSTNNFRDSLTEDLIAKNNEIHVEECVTTENYEAINKIETENAKGTTTTRSFLERNNEDLDKNKRNRHNDTKHNLSKDNSTKSSIKDGQKNPDFIELNNIKDSVKINFIDSTSSKAKENDLADPKSKTHKPNERILDKEVDKSSILHNHLKTKEEVNLKPITKMQNIEDNNKKCIERSQNETSDTNNDSNESVDKVQSLGKNNVAENETKTNKSKNFYKDQLMAVYKKITRENYKENLKKITKDEVKNNEPSPNKIIDTPNELDTPLNKCKTKSYYNKRTHKKPETNDNQITETKTNGIDVNSQKNTNCHQIHDTETNSNEVNKCNENINEEKAIKIDPKPVTSNKQINDNKSTNTNELNGKESKKDESCGIIINSDKASTETSLNITSNVKSAKYCLKCSSIFETEPCSYCAKKSQVQESRKNGNQVPRKSNG